MAATRGMWVVLVSLLVIPAPSLSRDQTRAEIIYEVIVGVQGHLNSRCVYLTETRDPRANSMLLSVQRRLSEDCLQSAILGMTSRLQQLQHRHLEDCSSPLYVFIEENGPRERLMALSELKVIAGKNWMIFLDELPNLEEYFLDVNIPFNCEFIVAAPLFPGESLRLTEVYKVAQHLRLQKVDFGSWSPTKGFTWRNQIFHERRSDLGGIVFRVVIHKWVPLAYILNEGIPGRRLAIDGFFGVVWKILEAELNFSSEFLLPGDGMWGSILENGTWDGLVGVLLQGKADMAGVGLTMTPERAGSVAFSLPLFINFLRIYIRQPRHVVALSGLISPFSAELWLALVACAVTLGTILAVLHKLDKQRPLSLDIIFQVFSAMFCQQGMAIRPTSVSKRIVVFLVYLIGLVIITSYSCFVISSLTTYRPEMPFYSLATFLEDGTYSLGMVKIGHLYEEFKNAQEYNQKQLKLAYDRHVATDPRNTPLTDDEGFQRVCQARYAYITEEGARLLATDLNCVVVTLKKHFEKNLVGFVFPKDSPYVGLFNHKLLTLMNSGILKKLFKDSYTRRPVVLSIDLRATLRTVAPILSVGLAGVVASLLVLAYEILTNHLYNKAAVGTVKVLSDRKDQKMVSFVEKSLVRNRLRQNKKLNNAYN